ncbi:hypothetical protein NLJ89_g8630 [Agrocybe chaxingu]|uniref:Intradiol ring-cleavage dioxygenases domain-containing protein n=1 Tax=Agrocybe chaxingu TaxID=84603 RepID=A0A9W8K238_9AGAR|nr:hypothetical protein NLJ89_g8630 [Agrocybe chaxingu]
MRFSTVFQLATLSILASAHPGEEHEHVEEAELVARENAMHARNLKARNCASAIAEFELRRRDARLPFAKRQAASTSTSSAAAPFYTTIQNTTCVTAPEVTEGPYYINNEFIRTDLRENQAGVKLVLDIGVIDTTTCEPFSNAFVELWHANATGAYGGYVGRQGAPTNINIDSFLRGGYFTNEQGIVEITSIYPGYYTGRTAHIHTMVHKNVDTNPNGTVISKSGTLTHIGQFFFDENWNDEVYAQSPYTSSTQTRLLNSADRILAQSGGVAFLNLERLGSTTNDGFLAYITVAVDGSQSYNINNMNTLQGTLTSSPTGGAGVSTSTPGTSTGGASVIVGSISFVSLGALVGSLALLMASKMGQDFKWVSIDKAESNRTGCEYGETVYDAHEDVMLRLLVPPSPMEVRTCDERSLRRGDLEDPDAPLSDWAGSRILFLGAYSDTMPPNSVSDLDLDVLAEMAQPKSDRDSEDEENDGSDEKKNHISLVSAFWILRNLNKKLYVRSNGIPTINKSSPMRYGNKWFYIAPHLGQVLLARCAWSSDWSCSMQYEGELNLTQGDWAGDRFDIRAFEEVAEELHQEGWEDVTRTLARQIYDIYRSDFGDSIGEFLEEPDYDSEDEDR